MTVEYLRHSHKQDYKTRALENLDRPILDINPGDSD